MAQPAKVIARNALFNLATGIVLRLGNLILVPLQARYLGPVGFGILSYGNAHAALWGLFGDLGLTKSLVRDIPQAPQSDRPPLLTSAMVLTTGASALIAFAAAAILLVTSPDSLTSTVGILLLGTGLLSTVIGVLHAAMGGLERMDLTAGLSLFSKVVAIVTAILVLVGLGWGVVGYAAALLVSGLLTTAVTVLTVHRHIPLSPLRHLTLKQVRAVLRSCLPFFAGMILGRTASQLDTIMLLQMLDANAVAFYQAGYKLVMVTFIVPSAIMNGAFPTLSRLVVEDAASAWRIASRLVRLLGLFSIPLVALISINADLIIRILYGSQFEGAGQYLTGLIFYALLSFTAFPVGTLLGSSGHQDANVLLSGISAIVNIGGNFVLIPRMGIMGAVTSTIASGLILAVGSFLMVRRRIPSAPMMRETIPVIITLLVVVGTGLATASLHPAFQSLAVVAAWLASAGTLGHIRRADLDAVLRAFRS